MQINTSSQPAPSIEFPNSSDTVGNITPERLPANTGFSSEFVASIADNPTQEDEQKAKRAKDLQVASDWISSKEINPEMSKMLPAAMTAPIALAEDVYNTAVDFTNYVSQSFGGEKLAENSEVIKNWLPQDTTSVVTREISKFLLGYTAVIKGITSIHKVTSTAGKVAQTVSAGAVADFVTAQPEAGTLFEDMVKRVPFGPDLLDLMGADVDDSNFEKRAREVIFGGVSGALAEGLFKAVKYFRKQKVLSQVVETPPPAPKGEGATAAADVEKVPVITKREELPPLPETDFIDASNKPVTPERAKEVFQKQADGAGTVNEIDKAGVDGRIFLNLTTMNTTDDVRRLVSNIVDTNPKEFSKQAYTDEEVLGIAADMNMTPAELFSWSEASGLKVGQLLAARKLQEEAAMSVVNVARMVEEGTVTLKEAALHITNAERIISKTQDMSSMAGLLLREGGIPLEKMPVSAKRIDEISRVFGSDTERIISEINKLGSKESVPKRLAKAIKKKAIAPVSDLLGQMRYASMLSNPATHTRNIFGGALNIGTRSGESLLAASFNAIKRDPHGVSFSEAYHESMGAFQGTLEAFQITASKMRDVDPKEFLGVNPSKSKIPDEIIASIDAQFETGNPMLKGIGGMLNGKFVSKALRFEDDFMKHINARMTLNREAYRKGYTEGTSKGLPKEEVAAIIQKELNDPSDQTLQMMFKDAEYNTFTNVPQGKLLGTLDSFSRDNPVISLISPFARTNINSLNYRMERIPGVGLLTASLKKEMNSASPAVRQRVLAKQTFAATAMVALGGYLHSRDAIIGSGPANSQRWKFFDQAGYQRNSIRVGDTWVEFRNETPLGGILSLVASVAELNDINDDEAMTSDYGLVATSIVGQLVNPDYLTSSLGELMYALTTEDANKAKSIIETGGSVASQFLPYSALIRGVQRELVEGGMIKREVADPNGAFGGVISTLQNQILGIYQPNALAMRRDLLGNPMMHKHGLGLKLISPFGAMDENKNPVIQELAKLTGKSKLVVGAPKFGGQSGFDSDFITITMPPRVVSRKVADRDQKIKLTPDQYEKLVQYSAGIHPKVDKTLEQTLSDTFKSDTYKKSSFRSQGVIVKEIINTYRRVGKSLFLLETTNTEELRNLSKSVLDKYRDDDILD